MGSLIGVTDFLEWMELLIDQDSLSLRYLNIKYVMIVHVYESCVLSKMNTCSNFIPVIKNNARVSFRNNNLYSNPSPLSIKNVLNK